MEKDNKKTKFNGFWEDTKSITVLPKQELFKNTTDMAFKIFFLGAFFYGTEVVISLLLKLIY